MPSSRDYAEMCAVVAALNSYRPGTLTGLFDAFFFVTLAEAAGLKRFSTEDLDYTAPFVVPSCGMETFISDPQVRSVIEPCGDEESPRVSWKVVDGYDVGDIAEDERVKIGFMWNYKYVHRKIAASIVYLSTELFFVLSKPSHVLGFVARRLVHDCSNDENVSRAVSLINGLGIDMSDRMRTAFNSHRGALLGRFARHERQL